MRPVFALSLFISWQGWGSVVNPKVASQWQVLVCTSRQLAQCIVVDVRQTYDLCVGCHPMPAREPKAWQTLERGVHCITASLHPTLADAFAKLQTGRFFWSQYVVLQRGNDSVAWKLKQDQGKCSARASASACSNASSSASASSCAIVQVQVQGKVAQQGEREQKRLQLQQLQQQSAGCSSRRFARRVFLDNFGTTLVLWAPLWGEAKKKEAAAKGSGACVEARLVGVACHGVTLHIRPSYWATPIIPGRSQTTNK